MISLNDEVASTRTKIKKSGVSLTCHLTRSVAFVGRVATGRSNIS